MTKRYKHLFFDLDHTLWDFDKNCEAAVFQIYNEFDLPKYGIDDFGAFFAAYLVHNDKLWARYRNGYIKRDELGWKRFWLALLDYKIGDTALAHELGSAYLEILPVQTLLTPYAKELLNHCSGRYSMHLITNGFETTQWLKLQYSGIASYFQEIITSEKSRSVKPHPEIFSYATKATGAACDECIMIGDALEVDVLGAYNAGWDQVFYNPKKIQHDRKPTYEVHTLQELLTIF